MIDTVRIEEELDVDIFSSGGGCNVTKEWKSA